MRVSGWGVGGVDVRGWMEGGGEGGGDGGWMSEGGGK